jgi:Mrp family chromosome partitioning ATPase
MTSLDQAFIKAFAQQSDLPSSAARKAAVPTCEPPASSAARPAGLPLRSPLPACGAAVAPLPVFDAFRDVLQTPPSTPLPPAVGPPETQRRPADVAWKAEALVGVEQYASAAPCVDAMESLDASVALPTTWSADAESPAVESWSDQRWCFRDFPDFRVNENGTVPFTVQSPLEQAAGLPSDAPVAPQFKPTWQVDRFTWPRVCRQLTAQAGEEFDRLADVLAAAVARGQKVLAFGSCSAGEGATTLMLCVARRLAERGVHLALMDADFGQPRLAKRLGIEPERGWNEPKDEGETRRDCAVVEATSNGLALAPLRESALPRVPSAAEWSRLASCLETLKDHYEMVLVDVGPLESVGPTGDLSARMGHRRIDAVVLVHNGRVTSEERLAEVQRRLTVAGVVVSGVIENFVAE